MDHHEVSKRPASAREISNGRVDQTGRTNYSRLGSPIKGWSYPLLRATSRYSLWSRSARTDKWIKRLEEKEESRKLGLVLKRQGWQRGKTEEIERSESSRERLWSHPPTRLVKHWQKIANTSNKFARVVCPLNTSRKRVCKRDLHKGATISSHKGTCRSSCFSFARITIHLDESGTIIRNSQTFRNN